MIGKSVKRREDPALVTGKGKYTDDLTLPGMTHAVIVRSPFAHAKINSIDASAALEVPGVVAVYTGADIVASGVGGVVPVGWLLPELKTPDHPIIATEVARHVGDGVAVVVAEDRYTARDAADLVEVDYEPFDAVTDPKAATADGAPQVHPEAPGNIAFDWNLGDADAVAAAFEKAAHVASLDLRNNRLIPHAVEPRGWFVIADVSAYNFARFDLLTAIRPRCIRALRQPINRLRASQRWYPQ